MSKSHEDFLRVYESCAFVVALKIANMIAIQIQRAVMLKKFFTLNTSVLISLSIVSNKRRMSKLDIALEHLIKTIIHLGSFICSDVTSASFY